MPETFIQDVPKSAADWQRLWSFTLDPYRTVRRPTREVRVGDIGIGGANPIRLQSMTISDTLDTDAVVAEIAALHAAGSEIVRVTAPNRTSAENLGAIKAALLRRGVRVPLVADIHFTPQAALLAAQHVEKVRINPGNYADRKHFKKWEYTDAEYAEEIERLEAAFRPLVSRCKELGVAMRIGTNHGSLSDRVMNRFGDTPLGMVESALEFVRICEHHGYRDLVLSMKASDVKVMIEAYRLLARRMRELGMDYPFHLGVTEAGSGRAARVKSAIGIVSLLEDGIGDTVRVSLTEDSVHEIPVARALVAGFAVATADLTPAAAARQATPLTRDVPRWDPYRFGRRVCQPLGTGPARLAADWPTRLELVRTLSAGIWEDTSRAVETVVSWIEAESGDSRADLVLVQAPGEAAVEATSRTLEALASLTRDRDPGLQPALGIELPAALTASSEVLAGLAKAGWARLSLRFDLAAMIQLGRGLGTLERMPPLQYTLVATEEELSRQPALLATCAALLSERFASGAWPVGALALEIVAARHFPAPHALRRLLAAWPSGGPHPPVVLRGPAQLPASRVDAHVTTAELRIAAALGALLADGVGDSVQLHADPDPTAARELAGEILQATRMRLLKADFIACPSCGRTQFDLQTTSARIEARLRHLKGLKIAIMGCIVNGPGEMADADFGYVGSGPGRIDLYVGRERVERNVPEADAETRLVDLIRAHGRWVEPGPSA